MPCKGPNASSRGAPPLRAVIGHMKAVGHLGPCYLKGRAGDAVNVILSAVGYNLRLMDHFAPRATPDLHNSASPQTGFFTGDAISMHDGGHTLRRGRMSKSASKVARITQMLRRIVRNLRRRGIGSCVSQLKLELSPWLEFGFPQIHRAFNGKFASISSNFSSVIAIVHYQTQTAFISCS